MNIYRNKKDKIYKTYYLAKVFCKNGLRLLGHFYESEEVLTGKRRPLNNSSHKFSDFYIVSEK